MWRFAWVIWLGACGTGQPVPDPDRAAYLAAIGSGPAACARIADPHLAGECLAFAAMQQAASDVDAARAQCAAIVDPLWADECGFMVCDRMGLSVDQARSCCVAAGRYSDRCIGHALSRDVYRALDDFRYGEEADAWLAARAVGVNALGPGGEERVADLFVKWLLDRVEGDTLRATDCGTAPPKVCAEVYAELVARVAGRQQVDAVAFVRAACARVVSRSRAESMGLPGWEPPVDLAVQMAFKRMCDR